MRMCVCHLDNYVSSCILNILDEHIEATAIINHCHLPLDITFLIAYQYKNSTRHNWKYTFVTSNQNERVLIPGLLLPVAPHAPVFLYARVPEREFNMHNSSFVAIEASFVAELSTEKWEEAEFLNHTVYITSTNDCLFSKQGQDPIPWIIGGLFAVALVSGALGGGCFLYRKKKLAVDQLALVTAMEVGLPGAQPYQVDAVVEKNPQNIETSSNESPKPEDTNTENMDSNNEMDGQAKQQNSEEASEQHRKGKKGFKFGRLKEEPVNFCNGSPGLKGMAVVIGNPAYQEESKQAQEEDKIKEKVQEQSLNVDPSVEDSQFIVGNGKVNGMYSEGDTPDSSLEDNISINKHQKVPEEEELSINGHPLETEDSLDGSGQVGQGARRKVRGMSSAITGSTTMVSAEVGNTSDSQKCL
ncbi:uncharacterized protein LOC121875683 isoform X2 [Homarus americanus]|uniref:uncharacterized protein LOC121875683 isoform X2 n=1 Tax=Homarus americanus TaxID=6706 RepID=UPI001C46A3FA|nr:uncharacterized protein LOC121875683 isoform X2 [Homarus americanus]XP_042236239.1 uncharacterized protein LOC121875683 isoform X2 [Homarus americanus]XP_042236240.1 uncharacterized protein LOC121875683 isoform X2 [Homarus americanus]